MGLQYNGTNIYAVNYNGVSLTQVNYNDVPVWYALTACSISGTAKVGSTWTAKTTPSEVQDLCEFQWYRGSVLISGATKSTYVATESDRGYQLKCVAKIGNASATSGFGDTIKQDVILMNISGVAEEGYTLTAVVNPSGATGAYQWYRGTTPISGATNSTYTLTHDDAKYYVSCKFTASGNWTGSVEARTSVVVVGWYSWSTSISNSSGSNYTTNISAGYTIPSGVICQKVSCSASVYNHVAQGEGEIAMATAHIYIGGSEVAKGGTASASAQTGATSTASASGSWGGGTGITVVSEGNTFRRSVGATLTGIKKG